MNRALVPLLIVAVIALGLWGREQMKRSQTPATTSDFLTGQSGNGSATAGETSAQAQPQGQTQQGPPSKQAATNTVSDSKSNGNAKASLSKMSYFLLDAARGNKNFERIVSDLKKSGQNPVVTRDSNPASGDMFIIRTQSPLPGTRYFHAQYFTDENNKPFVQHMSFEFQPGPTSMADAVQTAIRNFALGEPTDRKADFVQWDLDEDYVLWIKQKAAKDLKDDPFKAYDPKTDVGTIQMTVELKIHDDGDKSHSH
ncbi:hypothetical protein AZI86_10255 [Bdellovibrio bacteriovorus]|uniref:Uncharacterized protein n=1 Tax=Bdellovibrio bacteriovorus TaxID=959 RepID=A0A150WSN1_BDEBC|nr:hypothetical protein [Bdellovibrio bacteriovorus]KYG67367.1 hypothetical protein AZI86_10255 [Bdellovibrio bacteriovorus]